jgi:hypothetical protein
LTEALEERSTPEAALRFAEEDARQLILALYRGVLQRDGDENGVSTWSKRLINGVANTSDIIRAFINSDEFQYSHQRNLWAPPGHFYSPIGDREEASKACAIAERRPFPKSIVGIDIDRSEILRTWSNLVPFLQDCEFPIKLSPGFRYAFDNPSYSFGDGGVLQAMIRHFAPKRIIEIGTGWSSACIVDTVERYRTNNCEIVFVDPHPQLSSRLVGDTKLRVRSFVCGVQDVPLELFSMIERNDILFIDSTHVVRTGSDVCRELFEILPSVASGVLVHFHDIFWPFEYPRLWAVEENRSWNELYALRAFLMYNKEWEIIMFNDLLAKLERETIAATWPAFFRNTGGALWLRRK